MRFINFSSLFINFDQVFLIYIFTEESLDVDPNYDPSDFLMAGLPKNRSFDEDIKPSHADISLKIQDDLAVSESEDEGSHSKSTQQIQDDDDVGDVWF